MSPGGVGWEQGGPEPSHWETGCRAGGVPGLSSEGPPGQTGPGDTAEDSRQTAMPPAGDPPPHITVDTKQIPFL